MSDQHPFRDQLADYAGAVLAKDVERLASLYAPAIRVFDAWDRWSYDDLASWRANLESWLGSLGAESVKVDFDDVHSVAEGEMGFLTATVTYAALDQTGAVLRSLDERLSWVLVKEDGRWRIVHQHTSCPARFADHKVTLRRS
jgi:ketosteroid isomerase-like protein